MRIQKYISLCGAASRRAAEKLIAEGRVSLNGSPVTEPGVDVGEGDEVSLDGRVLVPPEEKVYILYNKPRCVMTTMSDDRGRRTVAEAFADLPVRVVPVGRLDYMTEGLLLMTNDGELTQKLTHPSHGVDKHYAALVDRAVAPEDVETLRRGVMLDGRVTSPAQAEAHPAGGGRCVVTISIHEGRNRQVRRMLESLGYGVDALRRTGVGRLTLEGVPVGRWRYLTDEEIAYLKSL